jgi:hypothetical protein
MAVQAMRVQIQSLHLPNRARPGGLTDGSECSGSDAGLVYENQIRR